MSKKWYCVMVECEDNKAAFLGGIEYHTFKHVIVDEDTGEWIDERAFEHPVSYELVSRPDQAAHGTKEEMRALAAEVAWMEDTLNWKVVPCKYVNEPTCYAIRYSRDYLTRTGNLDGFASARLFPDREYAEWKVKTMDERWESKHMAKSRHFEIVPIWLFEVDDD